MAGVLCSAATVDQLRQRHAHCPPGTVVFLQSEQTLAFRVDVGWRYLMVNTLKGPSHEMDFAFIDIKKRIEL
jgi:hypothetical protein